MATKKGKIYYKVTGRGHILGYTSSKTAFTKYYVSQGWKKSDLKFQKLRSKTK